jgi:hypothetical protein
MYTVMTTTGTETIPAVVRFAVKVVNKPRHVLVGALVIDDLREDRCVKTQDA